MKIYLAADHGGFLLKEEIKKFLERKKINYEDLGTNSKESTDYPDYAFKVGEKISKDNLSRGILICGTGTGMEIAANKVKGVRAALAYDNYSAKMARQDNNTNVLCLRGRFFPKEKAKKIISTFLSTKFSNLSRHKQRINKVRRYEK
jgi:ribose 5-phosphate isomerase B